MLMPNFAERLHVMHYAGEAEDWAVASHELLGLRHLVGIIIDAWVKTRAVRYVFSRYCPDTRIGCLVCSQLLVALDRESEFHTCFEMSGYVAGENDGILAHKLPG